MNLSHIYYLHEIGGKKNQEDYIWPAPGTATAENKIFIVCDGVGGSENGEVASRMVAEYTGNILLQTPPENISIDYINQLLADAKQNLIAFAQREGLNKDMATTFSVLMLLGNKAFIAWCGDSRVYHIRQGNVLYKTSDHSLVNSLVKKGEITEQEAQKHPQRHIILKAITGDDAIAESDAAWITDIADGDFFMLCTDGLLENITDADLKTLLTAAHTDEAAILPGMQERCFGKTRDNYSMYLIQINLREKEQAVAVQNQKTKSKTGLAWLLLLVAVVAVTAFFFLNRKSAANETIPAAVIKTDSVIKPASLTTAKDTLITPVKDSGALTEINSKEDSGIKKIIPAPLPETKAVTDSARHKKLLFKEAADSAYVNPQTLIKNSQQAQKKDSSLKHGKPLN